MPNEEWRPVTEPDFADRYMVSNRGRVAKILRGSVNKGTEYVTIILAKKGVAYKSFRIHQLVARAFNGEQPEETIVNHKDCDKGHNEPENLEYITQKENVNHAIRWRRRVMVKNKRNGQFQPLLTVDQVGEIKALISSNTPLHWIAEDYGVSTQAIKHIKTGRNWNRVPAKP
jgi:HNH endonuclease/NUMOD4 motif